MIFKKNIISVGIVNNAGSNTARFSRKADGFRTRVTRRWILYSESGRFIVTLVGTLLAYCTRTSSENFKTLLAKTQHASLDEHNNTTL